MGGIWSSFVGFLEWVLLEFAILTGSAGIGIILFTILARLVILPLTLSSLRSSRKMQEMQPLVKELQRKYGKEPQKLQEETIKLYREQKVNPAGSCLPLFLQLPIFFGVYQAVSHLMIPDWRIHLSPSVSEALQDPVVAEIFSRPFLGIDLGVSTLNMTEGIQFAGLVYLVLPLMSILLQFVQQMMATPRVMDPQQAAMMRAMMFMPLVFGYIAFTFPQGAVLYWATSSLIGVIQQYFISGWGSLANHLKFLPADTRPLPGMALAGAGGPTVTEVGGPAGTADEPQRERLTFWDVLKPLTEMERSENLAAEGAEDAEPISESTAETGRSQQSVQRKPTNPRRSRKRR